MTTSLLRLVAAHCEASAPDEAVGVVSDGPGGLDRHPLRNDLAALQAREPGRWPGTPATAFAVGPAEWMALERSLDAQGRRIAWLYHSHVDAPATLSATDRAFATPGGAPLVAGLQLLVVVVAGGRATSARAWRWDGVQWGEAEP